MDYFDLIYDSESGYNNWDGFTDTSNDTSSDWNNWSSSDSDTSMENPFLNMIWSNDNSSPLSDSSSTFYIPSTSNTQWSGNEGVGGSIKQVLNDLFTKGTTANQVGTGVSALLSGYQNMQRQSAANQMAKQVDPWASQRPFYQQQAQAAVTNPYDSPIVKAQIEQLQQAQNIKDAAAGRRSNNLTSSPAVMAEAAKIAQSYQQQMANQGGANISPSNLASILQKGSDAGVDGYISPLASAFGFTSGTNSNDKLLAALRQMAGGNK